MPNDPRVNGNHYRKIDGRFREENGNKLIGTLEREYKIDTGFRIDMKLKTALEKTDMPSQTQFLKHLAKIKNGR